MKGRTERSATRGVIFEGYYGMRNAGDDAFCVVAAAMAQEQWGAEQICFLGRQSDLPALPVEAVGLFPERIRFRGHGRLAPMPQMLRLRNVVHVGGSTFHSMNARHRDEGRLARLGLISLRAIGVSVGPFASEREGQEVVRHLRRFEQLHVRDAESVRRIHKIDPGLQVEKGFDVAVLLPKLPFCRSVLHGLPRQSAGTSSTPVLGISVCRDASLRGRATQQEELREARIRRTLRLLAARMSVRFRFIVFNDHPQWGDHELSERTAASLRDDAAVEIVPYTGDVRDTLEAVAGCDALLGVRLHSAIFAYALGVPFAIVAYHPKGRDFAEEIRLPEERVFPVTGPEPEEASETLAGLLRGDGKRPALPIEDAQTLAESAFAGAPLKTTWGPGAEGMTLPGRPLKTGG
jgi:polysaccharide pyruvyl transferase WcaK-like protein